MTVSRRVQGLMELIKAQISTIGPMVKLINDFLMPPGFAVFCTLTSRQVCGADST